MTLRTRLSIIIKKIYNNNNSKNNKNKIKDKNSKINKKN